jgi:hypothetical protein
VRPWLAWAAAGAALAVVAAVALSAYSALSALSGLAPGAGASSDALPAVTSTSGATPGIPLEAPGPALVPVSQQPEQQAQLLPPPAPGSWESTPLAQRGRAMGRAGVDLEQGLLELQDSLSVCFTRQGQASYQGQPVLEVARPQGDDTGSTVLTLQVVASGGELRVVDAPVEVRAGASDATLACLQARLREVRVPTEATPVAPRFRLRFTAAP